MTDQHEKEVKLDIRRSKHSKSAKKQELSKLRRKLINRKYYLKNKERIAKANRLYDKIYSEEVKARRQRYNMNKQMQKISLSYPINQAINLNR